MERLEEEKATENYDSQAMKYLSILLIPLVLLGAVYCLLYLSYKRYCSAMNLYAVIFYNLAGILG